MIYVDLFSNQRFYQEKNQFFFSTHALFCIGEINCIDSTNLLYQVDLELTANDDERLRNPRKFVSQKVTGPVGWSILINSTIYILWNILSNKTSVVKGKKEGWNRHRRVSF